LQDGSAKVLPDAVHKLGIEAATMLERLDLEIARARRRSGQWVEQIDVLLLAELPVELVGDAVPGLPPDGPLLSLAETTHYFTENYTDFKNAPLLV
jgi:hypothetical protein